MNGPARTRRRAADIEISRNQTSAAHMARHFYHAQLGLEHASPVGSAFRHLNKYKTPGPGSQFLLASGI